MRVALAILMLIVAFVGASTWSAEIQHPLPEDAWASWEEAKRSVYKQGKVDPTVVESAGRVLKGLLNRQLKGQNEEAKKVATEVVGFTTALAWAKEGEFEKAFLALVEEVHFQNSLGRRFLENTRQPYYFARDVFKLHAQILANTTHSPTIPGSGYTAFRIRANGGKKALFIYGTDEPVEIDVLIEGVEKNEQRKMIYLVGPGLGGDYSILDKAQIIGSRKHFSASLEQDQYTQVLILNGATKVIEYKGAAAVPIVHMSPQKQIKLRVSKGKIEQPIVNTKVGTESKNN